MGSYLENSLKRFGRILRPELVEIAINPDGVVWMEERGDAYMKPAPLKMTVNEVRAMATEIAADGRVRLSEKTPVGSVAVDHLDWMIRAQIVQSPAVRDGTAISMRFFHPASEIFAPAYLGGKPISASLERQTLAKRIADSAGTDLVSALKDCVAGRLNVVVSGGTSSGKTMVARWLVAEVPQEERIITIEDVPDLLPGQPNRVTMVSDKNDPKRAPDKLLQASLRMRPDRIILSEVVGADAYTFLKAINTGHGGSITTVHAETAELAVERLAQTALEADCKMTYQDMVSYVTRSIDVIVHVAKRDGARGVMEVYLPQNFNEENSHA